MNPYESRNGAPGDMGLDERTLIRIDLYLARRRAGRGAPTRKILALRERGRVAGMNTAEMLANEEGSSHDAKASACLDFVAALLAHPGAPAPEAVRRMHHAGYQPADIDLIAARAGKDAV